MSEVLKYKNTGLEYIRGKLRTLVRVKGEKSGMFVTNAEFDDWDSRNILFSQVLGLKTDKDRGGYDFEHAAETGIALPLSGKNNNATTEPLPPAQEPAAPPPLKNTLNAADKPATPRKRTPAKNTIDAAVETAVETAVDAAAETAIADAVSRQQKKKPESIVSIHTSRNVMMGVMLIVGILSLIMSTYHIIMYLIEPRGAFVAFTSAIAMTLFSSSAFTTGRYFWFLGRDKALAEQAVKNALIAVAFWVMGVAVVIYAMFATMDVNFNDFRNRQRAIVVEAVADDSAVKAANTKDEDLRAEAKRLDGILAAADAEKEPWLAEVSRITKALRNPELTDEQSAALVQSRSSAQYRANLIEKRVEADRAKRSKIGDQLTGVTDDTVSAEDVVKAEAEKGTFFALLNEIFGWDIETLKLIVYIIPAVFYDLMAPFALTVVMILEEKREEDEEEAVHNG